METIKKCPHCQSDIPVKAKKCPQCQTDLRNFFSKHPILTLVAVVFAVSSVLSAQSMQQQAEEQITNAPTAAELAAWKETPSGQLCAKHPTWQKEDCDKLVAGNVWVGMTYDMLLYNAKREPDTINPSNYGGKTKYQYCWTGSSPSCFYDNDDDGIIDAYN